MAKMWNGKWGEKQGKNRTFLGAESYQLMVINRCDFGWDYFVFIFNYNIMIWILIMVFLIESEW